MHNGSSGIHGSDMVVEELLPWKTNWKDRGKWWTECQLLEIKTTFVIGNGIFLIIGNNKI